MIPGISLKVISLGQNFPEKIKEQKKWSQASFWNFCTGKERELIYHRKYVWKLNSLKQNFMVLINLKYKKGRKKAIGSRMGDLEASFYLILKWPTIRDTLYLPNYFLIFCTGGCECISSIGDIGINTTRNMCVPAKKSFQRKESPWKAVHIHMGWY